MKKMIVGIVIAVGIVALVWDEQKRRVSSAVVVVDTRPCEQRGPGIVDAGNGQCYDTVRAAANLKEAIAQEAIDRPRREADEQKANAIKAMKASEALNVCGFRTKLLKEARKFYEASAERSYTGDASPTATHRLMIATAKRNEACR